MYGYITLLYNHEPFWWWGVQLVSFYHINKHLQSMKLYLSSIDSCRRLQWWKTLNMSSYFITRYFVLGFRILSSNQISSRTPPPPFSPLWLIFNSQFLCQALDGVISHNVVSLLKPYIWWYMASTTAPVWYKAPLKTRWRPFSRQLIFDCQSKKLPKLKEKEVTAYTGYLIFIFGIRKHIGIAESSLNDWFTSALPHQYF